VYFEYNSENSSKLISRSLITGSLDILNYFQFSKSYELIKLFALCLLEAHLYDFFYVLQRLIYRFAIRMTTPKQRATYYITPILCRDALQCVSTIVQVANPKSSDTNIASRYYINIFLCPSSAGIFTLTAF